tara:strand:+ start:122 stop:739 length:618 start_codon:yes stop_codon:yes gene_type:complete
MKKNKSSKNWVIKQHRDQFYKKSKVLGYRSRSAFKLLELNKKYSLINRDTTLLDIGASPGGWCQVAQKIIKEGKIVAIDIKSMKPIEGVYFVQQDFTSKDARNQIINIFKGKIDTIISDMAANTTGNKNLDCIRTNQLCGEVINFACEFLKPKGSLISKIFMGEDFIELKNQAKKRFKIVDFFKPEASRNDSKETYIHCALLKTL